ncbi:MAG: ABC transporter permease [Cyclobacteriaceae bacterium]|nr:ABC transporter permease [Cyclobacteriaceae bacterium]
MLTNYLKIAVRNLYKHKSFTLINLFGLVGGLTSAFVLTLIAYQQLRFDDVHTEADRIHLVYKERTTPNGVQVVYDTWVPLLEALKEDYPEIEEGTRQLELPAFLTVGTEKFQEQITFADPSLFKMFSISTQQGSGYNQLKEKSNIILSPETAARFFGNEDPVGKTVHMQLNGVLFDFTVSGVLDEIPVNSTIRPSMIASFDNALTIDWIRDAGWNTSFLYTYILLQKPAQAASLEPKFPSLIKKVYDEETASSMQFKLVSLPNYHDQLTQSKRTAYIMLSIALILIVVAVINYVNLTTVRSVERSKEIGLRKVLGATRAGLAKQFLGESFTLTTLAFFISVVALQAVLPMVNSWLGLALSFNVLQDPLLLLIGFCLFAFIGFSSGSFPALLIARYKLVESLKGKLKTSGSGIHFRKALIIVQFSLAIVLLFSMLVIYRQVDFMKNFNLGIKKDNIVVIPTDTDNMVDPAAARTKVAGMKKELLQYSSITHVSASNIVPSDVSQAGYTLVRPEGWTQEQPFRVMRVFVDESYFDLFEIKFLEGEKFSENLAVADTLVRNLAIINEAALKAFGWDDIDGKKIGIRTQVVGLVADHYNTNLSQQIEPIIFVYRPMERQSNAFISVRFNNQPNDVMKLIESKWRLLDETRPFNYFFVDKNFEQLYRAEDRNIKIISWFSGLTIMIACIGLLGLISFTLEQKTKEIGIRKVLGSSVTQITVLLNKEFVKLISVSLLIALPASWLLMTRWLQDFAIRIPIHWSWFVWISLLTIALALLTTSFKVIKAALANPVESLRTE